MIFIGPAHCEPAQIIGRAGCGLRVDPGDVDGLVAAIHAMRGDAGLRMGAAGHALFLHEFNRPVSTARLTKLLDAL